MLVNIYFAHFAATEMKYTFITIEGNIGAGKTTLAHLLSKHFNARLILEEFADNPFFPSFTKTRSSMLFRLNCFLWPNGYKQLKELIRRKTFFKPLPFPITCLPNACLFAKVNLPEDEFRLYQRLFDIIHQQLVQPEILIYLHAPVNSLQENIKKRHAPTNKKFRTNTCSASRKPIPIILSSTT